MNKRKTPYQIRLARTGDLKRLLMLEILCFETDTFDSEHIDEILHRARSTVFVLESADTIFGAAYLLWNAKKSAGRVYSVAIHPEFQNTGWGSRLLVACEEEACRRNCIEITLEVRLDNQRGIRFYEKHGYVKTGIEKAFYEDGSPALRMSKQLTLPFSDEVALNIPYYEQTLDFTCGPACLTMALCHFQPRYQPDRILELNIWKEATQVFMTTGIGGTDPFGLALSAAKRGLRVRVISSGSKIPFIDSVRKKEKKEVIRLLHDEMKKEAIAHGVTACYYNFGFSDILSALRQGWTMITLINLYRFTGKREPHWVLITGMNKHSIFVHDPYKHAFRRQTAETQSGQIPRDDFRQMNQYGDYRCLIIIGPNKSI